MRETRVYYITGNHDELLREFVDYKPEIGDIRLVNEAVHHGGDRVESCTALTEDINGRIQLVRWIQLDHLNSDSHKVTPLAGARRAT